MPAPPTWSLVVSLPSDREIRMIRSFRAPRELVFKAHIDPEHLRRWWGPRAATLAVCDLELRPAGRYRFVCREPDGTEHAFRGEYLRIEPPALLEYTFEYEGFPGHVSVETLTFEEAAGITTLTSNTVYASRDDRDATLQSGMESGAAESMDRLEELLRLIA